MLTKRISGSTPGVSTHTPTTTPTSHPTVISCQAAHALRQAHGLCPMDLGYTPGAGKQLEVTIHGNQLAKARVEGRDAALSETRKEKEGDNDRPRRRGPFS